METRQHEIGMVGLGVMGRNLLLNMADHGFPVTTTWAKRPFSAVPEFRDRGLRRPDLRRVAHSETR